jgi:hypothetical protein
MPTVGNKKFLYTPEGVAKARREERITGTPMNMENNYKGGVNPNPNPNANAVNNFMDRSVIEDKNNPMANNRDVMMLQNGLNKLNRNNQSFQPLKVDGVLGPKTKTAADNYLGKPNNRGKY